MLQKQDITFDCLFLHDTPGSVLEREQALFRRMLGSSGTDRTISSLPFNILPPFFPAVREPEGKGLDGASRLPDAGRLLVGKTVNIGGWLVRPVRTVAREHQAEVAGNRTACGDSVAAGTGSPVLIPPPALPRFPLYPPLPDGPEETGFIIGWAGDRAEELLGARASLAPDPSDPPDSPFEVRVWYYASVTVRIECVEGGMYSCFRETGPACWRRARE